MVSTYEFRGEAESGTIQPPTSTARRSHILRDFVLPAVFFAAALVTSFPSRSVSDTPSLARPGSAAAPAAAGKSPSVPRSSSSPGSQVGGALACPAHGASVAEPYRWYPSLDLARIPFHVAAGPWGPRVPITAPSPPVTRRSVRVTSAAQLASEALIPGTLITVDADYIGHAVLFGNVSDVDIVVPPGRRVAQLTIGSYTPRSTTQRVRIRGTTPGVHSGGVIGNIVFLSNPATDVIIDGVDLNGDDGNGGGWLWNFGWPAERVAVVNVRGHAVSDGGGMNGGVDVVIAGNRITTGARPSEVVGAGGGWGIRGGDRIVVYDNRIDGNRFHRVRVHPIAGRLQYAWVANNTFVDPHEARIFSTWNLDMNKNNLDRYAAVWAICNRVYAHSTCMPASFDGQHASYAMLTSNTLFGSMTENTRRNLQDHLGPGHDYLSGNKFSPWQAPPAWEAPGDPTTTVPLPAVKPERYNVAFRHLPNLKCPAP